MGRILALGVSLLFSLPISLRADDWPQWLGPKRDAVWSESGIVDTFPEGGPKVLWRAKISGGYAGPAVAGGKVFVPDYVSDNDFRKHNNPGNRSPVQGKERVVCLDAATGKELWTFEYDCRYAISYPAGPRCTPTVDAGKVYFLGAEGNLTCLDADKGSVVWSKDFKKEYKAKTPVWGFCGHPLVDGQKLICVVGGEKATIVAFDKDTGQELWKALSAREPGYCPPSIIEAGGTRQLVVWDSEALSSLDPESGKTHWSVALAPAYAMSIPMPRKLGDYLYAGAYGGKCAVLKLAADKPAVEELWRGTAKTGVYPVNMTAFAEGEHLYAVNTDGDLTAVEVKTGKRLWTTPEPVTGKKRMPDGTAFIVKNAERFFLFNELGELVIARLGPEKCEEISRAKILKPTNNAFGRDVLWTHPAFANKCMFVRNDQEIVCVSLAK